ncbi:MAG: hypothetical protein CMJ18_05840 [Phycisphaeraceae bacterium]|nr:hypothetical protein [Phycisphaeraceae bacterium]
MLDRDALLSGTRPEIDQGRILMTGSDGFDGYEIVEYKGMVWGISVRAKDMGQDCAMGCKQMTGGELDSYTALGDESRQRAIDRMLEMAARQGCNGVINVDFELQMTGAGGGSNVVVHGTAVVIKPIQNYVPTGAMGNIVAEIADRMNRS